MQKIYKTESYQLVLKNKPLLRPSGNKPPQVFRSTYNSLVVRIHGLYSSPLGQVGGLVLVWTDGTFPLPLEVFPQVPGQQD